jgi:N-acetylneuraminate synthase
VDFLEKLEIPAYKLGSPDLTNLPLIDYVAAKGKPIILSTGMSTLDEVRVTVEFLKARRASFALLHCNSTYPAPFEDINLRVMERLREFGVPVGYSGHERGIAVSIVAAALGACVVERHVTLDRTMLGPDHAASLEPQGLQKLVRDIRIVETAFGDGVKRISTKELQNREILGKSLAAKSPIAPGETVTTEMLKVIGPGKGLSPQRIGDVVGRRARRALKVDDLFYEHDLVDSRPVFAIPDFRHPWGFKTRFGDVEYFSKFGPRLVEHHLSDRDLTEDFPRRKFTHRLFVHAPEFWGPRLVDLCSRNDEMREMAIGVIARTLDKVREMAEYYEGPPSLVIHVGGMSLDDPDARTDLLYDNARDSLRRLDTTGVIILPENLPPRPWYFGGQWYQNAFIHPEEILEFCKSLSLSMCFDICHAQLYCTHSGMRLEDYIERVKPLISHVHLSDAHGIAGEGLQIGEGQIDFAGSLELLRGISFTWVPEIWRGHNNGGEGFMVALNRLARYRHLL